ncbi:S-adenosyl-L-methionine-dependent methyltransferase [Pelagophyceae sp. CCMP2097]|nr:S-adenosyl-L-methionine-dependent methyltransferase [Pelagophyceae sp. CCMP2097]
MLGSEAKKASDYANYFSSYAFLYHQKQMLSDNSRMCAYRDAIMQNKDCFKGKVVLDVGAGSGILSLWAAKAGAKKVYACEFTSMAVHAEALVKANGLAGVVEVRRSAVEALDLEPGSVDIIISEWMGYFLLRESMLDSVIYARDKFLKPGGALYPSHATMYWAPADLRAERDAKVKDMGEAMADWDAFAGETTREHGVDVQCLRGAYDVEQTSFYLRQAQWAELKAEVVLCEPEAVFALDLNTVTLEQSRGFTAKFDFAVPFGEVCAFAAWFTVDFLGSPTEKTSTPVCLSTAPEDGYTHWGQQVFYVAPGDAVSGTKRTTGSITMRRQREQCRLYSIAVEVEPPVGAAANVALNWELS